MKSDYQVFHTKSKTEERNGLVKAWIDGVQIDENTLEQAQRISQLAFIHKHVALMPDAHVGKGATIGTVIATKGAIVPAATGVDIGCGMNAVRLNLTAEDIDGSMPAKFRDEIESRIPVGFKDRTNDIATDVERKVWTDGNLAEDLQPVTDDLGLKNKQTKKGLNQLGTLGGGNHFIELCFDENKDVWIMLHSGSRGLGNIIGTQYIQRAKEDMRRHFINLPDADLAYLVEGSEHYNGYVRAVSWAQRYASANRSAMLTHVMEAVQSVMGERRVETTDHTVSCHHNYIEMENHFNQDVWVTRKGAVRARQGDRGIIPGSMGAKSYIVNGKGNPESFHSCSHGAGRAMSRTEAKRRFSRKDLEAATRGVDCPKTSAVVDEIPMAYKDIEAVMNAQKELVDIEHTLKQFVCVKG